jgi:hypothetical protein
MRPQVTTRKIGKQHTATNAERLTALSDLVSSRPAIEQQLLDHAKLACHGHAQQHNDVKY